MQQVLTRTLRIKGARYYEAGLAFTVGDLRAGAEIALKPEPNNKFDSNAVAVYLNDGKMLGHIAKDSAAKYQKLCFSQNIKHASVVSAEKVDDFSKFNIKISISYFDAPYTRPNIYHTSSLDASVPNKPGVYEISFGFDRFYIGATENLQNRKSTHLGQLNKNSHSNKVIQRDFNEFGMGSFIFHIIKLTRNFDEAGKYEEQEIRERLRRGVKLYNKTVDGKGTNPSGEESFSTISDYHRAGNKILGKSDDKSETIKFQKKGEQSSLSNAENFCASLQGIDLKNSITQVMTLENGEVYRGEVVKGWAEGKGQVKWPNGDIYTGDFQANKPTGSGVFHWADGTIYKGDVVDGKITGKGIYAWPNGDRLDGDFIDGKRLRNSKFTRGR